MGVHDAVNSPAHYTQYQGLEVIDLTEQMTFNRGNVVKYVARAGAKDPAREVEDLQKARWYLDREIRRVGGEPEPVSTDLDGATVRAGDLGTEIVDAADFAARFNSLSAGRRDAWVRDMIADKARASRCFAQDHEGSIEALEHSLARAEADDGWTA